MSTMLGNLAAGHKSPVWNMHDLVNANSAQLISDGITAATLTALRLGSAATGAVNRLPRVARAQKKPATELFETEFPGRFYAVRLTLLCSGCQHLSHEDTAWIVGQCYWSRLSCVRSNALGSAEAESNCESR
jgi:hypothetical protein